LGIIPIWGNTGDDWRNIHLREEDLYNNILSRALSEFPKNPTKQDFFDLIDSVSKPKEN